MTFVSVRFFDEEKDIYFNPIDDIYWASKGKINIDTKKFNNQHIVYDLGFRGAYSSIINASTIAKLILLAVIIKGKPIASYSINTKTYLDGYGQLVIYF